jgi:hypothetical protein
VGPYHHPQEDQGGQNEHPRWAVETLVEGTGWDVQVRMRRHGSCRPSSVVPQADVKATASVVPNRNIPSAALMLRYDTSCHLSASSHLGLLHVHVLHGKGGLGEWEFAMPKIKVGGVAEDLLYCGIMTL